MILLTSWKHDWRSRRPPPDPVQVAAWRAVLEKILTEQRMWGRGVDPDEAAGGGDANTTL